MNSIFTRRSIRKFTQQPVSDADLQQCLKAAMHAPSAGNEQAWEFIVTRSAAGIQALHEAHPYGRALESATTVVTICGNRGNLKFPQDYWIEDCSAAAQNFMLQAAELELGTVWLAVYPCEDRIERISAVLNLPTDVIPLCMIPIGYPDEVKAVDERYKPEKIHHEKW